VKLIFHLGGSTRKETIKLGFSLHVFVELTNEEEFVSAVCVTKQRKIMDFFFFSSEVKHK